MSVERLIEERTAQYGMLGDFLDKSTFSQSLKEKFRDTHGWPACADDQRDALDMIAHKMARILCGNPNHEDSWRDIAGYATLVAQRLKA